MGADVLYRERLIHIVFADIVLDKEDRCIFLGGIRRVLQISLGFGNQSPVQFLIRKACFQSVYNGAGAVRGKLLLFAGVLQRDKKLIINIFDLVWQQRAVFAEKLPQPAEKCSAAGLVFVGQELMERILRCKT